MNFFDNIRAHAFVHLGWTIGVLIGIIILLFSIKIGTGDKVKDIINTALALGSVVLAFFAIIQAFVSGGSLTEVVGSLKNEIDQIKEPANEIKIAANLLTQNSLQINTRAQEIEQRLSTLNKPVSLAAQGEDKDKKSDLIDLILNTTLGGLTAVYLCIKSYESKNRLIQQRFSSNQEPADMSKGTSLL